MDDRIMTRGELARAAGVNAETVRYYERRGLLPRPARTPSGYRQYAAEDASRLRFIKRAQELGFSLEEVDTLLNLRADPDAPSRRVRAQATRKIEEIQSRIYDLQRIQATLEHLVDACDGHGPTRACPILDALDAPFEHSPHHSGGRV